MALPKEIQTARLFLASEHPYIASVLWNLRPVEKPGIGTMGVDEHWRLYYDPAIGEKWTEQEITGVLFHEVNHILRGHQIDNRAKPYMHCTPPNQSCAKCHEHSQRWNWAADAEINPGLQKLGFKLPEDGIYPSKFGLPDGLLSEEYYDLFDKQKMPPPCQHGQGQPGNGKGPKHPHPGCGGVAGNKQTYEDGEPAEADKISDTEKDLMIRDVAKKIEDHVKNRGNVPAGLERWADQLLHPKVNWRKELKASARRQLNEVAGKREYSFKRPHRRQSISKTILPTLRDFNPRIGVIRDTSGSMSDKDLARSISETRGILDSMGGTVVDIEVDCQVHAVKEIKKVREIKLQGGGGTDMGVGIDHAATLKPALDICVVITDGYTPWPSTQPPFKCIVVLTQEGTQKDVPSWAKTIVVND
jgi:predicted metal-dependent peptidase